MTLAGLLEQLLTIYPMKTGSLTLHVSNGRVEKIETRTFDRLDKSSSLSAK